MSEFVYLFRGAPPGGTPQQMQAQMQKWVAWMKDLDDKGLLKNPGQPLEPSGKVVKDKKKTVSDGPYAEKDIVGGVMFVEARDIAHAVEISTGCPVFDVGGVVEVRPVLKM
jgi:hypothetical protein